MRSFVAVLLAGTVLAAAASMAACSSSPDTTAAPDGGDDAAVDVATDTAQPPDEPAVTYHVGGTVLDFQDAGYATAQVTVCASLCVYATVDDAGAFTATVPAGDGYHVKATGTPGDGRTASALEQPIGTLDKDVTLAAPLYLPETGAGTVVSSAQTVDLGDVTLAVDPATLSLPFGVTTAYAAAIAVPADKQPGLTPDGKVAGKTILGMWALNPYGTTSSTPMAVTFKNTFGLSPSDPVTVYTMDDNNAQLVDPSDGTVSGDGQTITGATVKRMTWIVLAH